MIGVDIMPDFTHIPVMVKEVKKILAPKKGKVFVDGTCGLGGHTKMLAKSGASIIAIDCDQEALKKAQENLANFEKIQYIHGNFADIDQILADLKIDPFGVLRVNTACFEYSREEPVECVEKVDGVLLDLGVSSMQLEDESRGFSFQKDSLLDMRMDKNQDLTAEKIINNYQEEDLERIFSDYGEERFARRIARVIVEEREKTPIKTTKKLVEVIKMAIPLKYRYQRKIHFATNIFRALRMEVNSEVENLSEFLGKVTKYVKSGNKIVIISFHSIEDRIVKRGFKMLKSRGEGKIVTQKPIVPSKAEIKKNRRSRSAKLRAIETI